MTKVLLALIAIASVSATFADETTTAAAGDAATTATAAAGETEKK